MHSCSGILKFPIAIRYTFLLLLLFLYLYYYDLTRLMIGQEQGGGQVGPRVRGVVVPSVEAGHPIAPPTVPRGQRREGVRPRRHEGAQGALYTLHTRVYGGYVDFVCVVKVCVKIAHVTAQSSLAVLASLCHSYVFVVHYCS